MKEKLYELQVYIENYIKELNPMEYSIKYDMEEKLKAIETLLRPIMWVDDIIEQFESGI